MRAENVEFKLRYLRWYIEFLTLEKAPQGAVSVVKKMGSLLGIEPRTKIMCNLGLDIHDLVLNVSLELFGMPLDRERVNGVNNSRYSLLKLDDEEDEFSKGRRHNGTYAIKNYADRTKYVKPAGIILSSMYVELFAVTGNQNLIDVVNKKWELKRIPVTGNRIRSAMQLWEGSMPDSGEYIIPERYDALCAKSYYLSKVTKERYFELLDTIYRPLTNPGGTSDDVSDALAEMSYIRQRLL